MELVLWASLTMMTLTAIMAVVVVRLKNRRIAELERKQERRK